MHVVHYAPVKIHNNQFVTTNLYKENNILTPVSVERWPQCCSSTFVNILQ